MTSLRGRGARAAAAVLVVAATAAGAIPALAQAVYGTVAGTVRDASGAAVPGATVTITSHERGSAVTMTTNASGFYVKGQILPGRYEVKAALRGFKTKVIASVVVSVDTQTLVNLDLDVGEISEELVVASSEGQLLKTDRADVPPPSSASSDRAAGAGPQLHQVLLLPGTQTLQWQQNAAENPQRSVLTQVNGQSRQHWLPSRRIDNRDAILGLIVVNLRWSPSRSRRSRPRTTTPSSGQARGPLVSVQTKSGSNDSTAAPTSSSSETNSRRGTHSPSSRRTRSPASTSPTAAATSSAARWAGPS